jgi:hypothetical protein
MSSDGEKIQRTMRLISLIRLEDYLNEGRRARGPGKLIFQLKAEMVEIKTIPCRHFFHNII